MFSIFFLVNILLIFLQLCKSEEKITTNQVPNFKENNVSTEFSRDFLNHNLKDERIVRYKVSYFDFRGRGEAIRLLLHYAGESFEDFRIPKNKWISDYKNKTPYGHVPILEVKSDGRVLAESHAILRFLARKFELAGQGYWHQAKVDEFADFHKDVDSEIHGYLYPADKEKTSEMLAEVRKLATKNFPIYERQLAKFESGFLFLKITWVDFLVADFLETVRIAYPVLLSDFPIMDEYRIRVHGLPQLANYIKIRKLSY